MPLYNKVDDWPPISGFVTGAGRNQLAIVHCLFETLHKSKVAASNAAQPLVDHFFCLTTLLVWLPSQPCLALPCLDGSLHECALLDFCHRCGKEPACDGALLVWEVSQERNRCRVFDHSIAMTSITTMPCPSCLSAQRGAYVNVLSWAADMVVNSRSYAKRMHEEQRSSWTNTIIASEAWVQSMKVDAWNQNIISSTWPAQPGSKVPIMCKRFCPGYAPILEGGAKLPTLVGTKIDDCHRPNADCVDMLGLLRY